MTASIFVRGRCGVRRAGPVPPGSPGRAAWCQRQLKSDHFSAALRSVFNCRRHLARFLRCWRADPTTWLCATRFTCRSDRRNVRAGPSRSRAGVAWNAGEDGPLLLSDPLCESALRLLARGGSLLLVQSAFSGIGRRWRVCARVASTQKSLPRARFRWGRCSQLAPGGLEVSGRQPPQALRLLVALSANSPFDQGRDTCAPPLTPAAEQTFSGPTALGDELFVSATQSRDMCCCSQRFSPRTSGIAAPWSRTSQRAARPPVRVGVRRIRRRHRAARDPSVASHDQRCGIVGDARRARAHRRG